MMHVGDHSVVVWAIILSNVWELVATIFLLSC